LIILVVEIINNTWNCNSFVFDVDIFIFYRFKRVGADAGVAYDDPTPMLIDQIINF